MKIVFFSRLFYPHVGGVERHVLEVGKRLLSYGHQVVVVTERFDSELSGRESVEGVEVYRVGVGGENKEKKFRVWKELWGLRKVILGADIVHCHDVFFWYLPFRFLFPRKKVYTTFHGYETKFPPEKSAIRVRKLSEKLSYGNICVGEFIEKWYGTKADYVVYGGISEERKAKSEKRKTALKIIFTGRLEKDTGVAIYLQALELLKKNKIRFSFEAFGDGTLRKDVEKFGTVHGFVVDTTDEIKSADIVFASSYLTMLESLVLKKIVIAVFDNPLKEDYLRMSPFSRYIFICKNAQEIADVIATIQKDPWKTRTMVENGSKWASTQTWDNVTKVYEKLWHV